MTTRNRGHLLAGAVLSAAGGRSRAADRRSPACRAAVRQALGVLHTYSRKRDVATLLSFPINLRTRDINQDANFCHALMRMNDYNAVKFAYTICNKFKQMSCAARETCNK